MKPRFQTAPGRCSTPTPRTTRQLLGNPTGPRMTGSPLTVFAAHVGVAFLFGMLFALMYTLNTGS